MQPIGHAIHKKDEVCLPEGWDFFKDLVAESGDITPFEMHEHTKVGMTFGNGRTPCPPM